MDQLLRLRALLKRLRAHLKDYDPNEPRAPAGQPGAGQWTSGGGGAAGKPAGRAPSKPVKAAARYRNVARRRRVIAAVKVEGELARAIAGLNLPDSEPADIAVAADSTGRRITDPGQLRDFLRHREVLVRTANDPRRPEAVRRRAAEGLEKMPLHFVEVKTLLTSPEDAVHINKPALRRKERWRDRYGARFHVVAVDRRRGGKHSGHEVHLAADELAGTFRLGRMEKVNGLADVLRAICPECAGHHDTREKLDGLLRRLRLRGR